MIFSIHCSSSCEKRTIRSVFCTFSITPPLRSAFGFASALLRVDRAGIKLYNYKLFTWQFNIIISCYSFFLTCNTLVHVVMYSYYFMAAMGPQFQKYLWWKKYLTVFQMIQFVCVGLHSLQLFFITCNYPKAYAWGSLIQTIIYFILFKNYHTRAYSKNTNRSSNASKSVSTKSKQK